MRTLDEGKIKKILDKYRKSFFSGLYAYLILLTMEEKGEPTYGYEIAKMVELKTQGFVKLTMGTLYPILKKLEKDGILKSYWMESKDGPPRKYYVITDIGKEFLKEVKKLWEALRSSIDKYSGVSGN